MWLSKLLKISGCFDWMGAAGSLSNENRSMACSFVVFCVFAGGGFGFFFCWFGGGFGFGVILGVEFGGGLGFTGLVPLAVFFRFKFANKPPLWGEVVIGDGDLYSNWLNSSAPNDYFDLMPGLVSSSKPSRCLSLTLLTLSLMYPPNSVKFALATVFLR